MTPLPPPDARDRVAQPARPHTPRRRHGLIVAAAGVLGVCGLTGAQIAGATEPDGSIEDTVHQAGDAQNDPVEVGEADSNPAFDAQFEAYDACMAEQLPDMLDGGGLAGVGMIEIGPDGASDFAEFEWPDAVTIHAGGEDGTFTMLDLGDGDGTITITKTDGDVEVTSDGDVEQLDIDLDAIDDLTLDGVELDVIDAETDAAMPAAIEQFDAAHEECEDLLPDSVELVTETGPPAEAGDGER